MKKIYPYINTETASTESWSEKGCRYVVNKTPKRCPVCEGSGIYEKAICHGCGGRGWVVVDESYIDMEGS